MAILVPVVSTSSELFVWALGAMLTHQPLPLLSPSGAPWLMPGRALGP